MEGEEAGRAWRARVQGEGGRRRGRAREEGEEGGQLT